MFFSVHTKSKQSLIIFRFKIKKAARNIILLSPENSSEKILDRYIMDNYKTNLKGACLFLVKNANISTNYTGDFIITFNNKKWDDLASLITYGNGRISGSKILRRAFTIYDSSTNKERGI